MVEVSGDTGCGGRRCAHARYAITARGDVSAMARIVGSGGGDVGGGRRGAGRQGVRHMGVVVAVQAPVEGDRKRLGAARQHREQGNQAGPAAGEVTEAIQHLATLPHPRIRGMA